MDTAEIMWLALIVLFLVAEGASAAITSIWFAVGSMVALIAALLGAGVWLQIGIFAVVSVGCLLALQPLLKKYINPRKTNTDVDALIGKQAVVLERIDNLSGVGRVKIGGMEWSARSATGEPIEKDTVVVVEKIEGVKVFVSVHNQKSVASSCKKI